MIKRAVLTLLKVLLNLVYWPFKRFRTKNKIVFISRQFDFPNLDFQLLRQHIETNHPEVEMLFLCRKLRAGFLNKLRYIGFIFSCMYHLATSRRCVTDTYNMAISLLRHKKDLVVVQIWHALGAIKKFGHQTVGKHSGSSPAVAQVMNMHKNYDYVLASGRETARYYCEAFQTDMDHIKLLGMPRMDYILSDFPEMKQAIHDKYPALLNKKNILYVPTFRRDQTNDMNQIDALFDFDHYNLVIKYHPLDKTKQDRTVSILERAVVIYEREFSIFDLYKLCDAVITDYSSAALEACLLEKPLYFYVYDIEHYRQDPGLNIDPLLALSFCSSADFSDIMAWIREDRYDHERLRAFKEQYFDIPLDGSATRRLAEFLVSDIKKGR